MLRMLSNRAREEKHGQLFCRGCNMIRWSVKKLVAFSILTISSSEEAVCFLNLDNFSLFAAVDLGFS